MSTSKSSIVAICVVLFTTASWKFKARDIETNKVYQRTIDELVHDYDQRLKEQNEMHNMQMGNLTKKYGELLTAQVEDHEKQIANLKKTHAEELNLSRKELRSTLTENCKHQLDTKNNHAKELIQQYVGKGFQWAVSLVLAFVGIFITNLVVSLVHSCTKWICQKRT